MQRLGVYGLTFAVALAMSRAATPWNTALVAVVSACARPEPHAPPLQDSAPGEHPIRPVVPRPAFLACAKQSGPARPLYTNEVFGWARGKRRHWQSQVDFLERTLSSPDEDPLDHERYEMTLRLAVQGLGVAEENTRTACHLERSGDDPDALQAEWARLERNLGLALHAAESVFAMNPPDEKFYSNWIPLDAPCLLTLAASRTGDVERARTGAAALVEGRPCSMQALAEFGHVLHEAGLYTEARTVFDRAAKIESQLTAHLGDIDVACPSATAKEALATIADIAQPDLREHWCSWADYLKYRAVHSSLALAELDGVAGSVALPQLAEELRRSDRRGVETIILAIDHDVEQLAAAH